jgi:hypothetical protein
MIVFSLKEPIAYDKICKKIDDMLKKEIKNRKQAENSLLVIDLKEAIDYQEIKKIN